MSRNPLIFSSLCILGLTVFSLYMWFNLPEMERYPIHWNAAGEADGFASRNAVLGTLMMMPVTQIFVTAVLYFVPKIEPLRENLEQSRLAYNSVWMATMAFLTVVGGVMAFMYKAPSDVAVEAPLRWMAGGMSLLFIGIGNVLGKVRQNFMFGIRTPWTLSSELSWEKTHRIGGRLLVLSGFVGIVFTAFLPFAAFPLVIAAILAVVFFCLIYSYIIWKGDPNKRK